MEQIFQDEEEMEERDKLVGDGSDGPLVVTVDPSADSKYDRVFNIIYQNYLIVDVRDMDDYNICHIRTASCVSGPMMRSDRFPLDFYFYKNREGTVIILYCDEEKESTECATLLINKGYDNVFLLTGGLKEFGTEYPFYIEGDLPKFRTKTTSQSSRRSSNLPPQSSRKRYFIILL